MAARIKIPYLNTRPDTDMMITFLLVPLWWILGFSVFVYHLTISIIFIKLLMHSVMSNQSVKIPKATKWFILFLIFYLLSVLLNAGLRPPQRIFASLNNYSMLVMGFLIIVVAYNSPASLFFQGFLKTCRWLCIFTGILGGILIGMWFHGYKNLETEAWLGQKLPFLFNYPYFYNLLVVTGTLSDWFSRSEIPRLTLYSTVATATGGFMLILTPMMMAYYALAKKGRLEYWIVLAISLVVLFFSLSRAAVYAFISAVVFIHILARGVKAIFAFLCFVTVLFFSGYIYKGVEWILNIRRHSTIGRLELYQEALRIVTEENFLMGIGVRLREGFTLMAIGSHAHYIELLLVTGIIGISLFILFQFLVARSWYSQKRLLRSRTEKVLWKYLGISLLALNIWLLTDSLLALPFISYGYFLVTAGVFSLEKMLRSEPASEELGILR